MNTKLIRDLGVFGVCGESWLPNFTLYNSGNHVFGLVGVAPFHISGVSNWSLMKYREWNGTYTPDCSKRIFQGVGIDFLFRNRNRGIVMRIDAEGVFQTTIEAGHMLHVIDTVGSLEFIYELRPISVCVTLNRKYRCIG